MNSNLVNLNIDLKKQSNIYPCIYKDQSGQLKCTIENSFDEEKRFPLFMELGGIKFLGSSFDDFELAEPQKYADKQLNRFTFNKIKVWGSEKHIFELCNCELNLEIPIELIDREANTIIDAKLLVNLKLGKPASNGGIDYENAIFEINLKGENYSSEGDLFEVALVKLQNQFDDKYHFKNCFGCLYSDYSPLGNGFFGDLICFRNHKKEYLSVNSKEKLFELIEKNSIDVQETYCCDKFEKRAKNIGYRS